MWIWILAIAVVIIVIIIIIFMTWRKKEVPMSHAMKMYLSLMMDSRASETKYPSYNFARGRWMRDAIIDKTNIGKSTDELVSACDALAECRAFNSSGELIDEPYLTHQIPPMNVMEREENPSGGIYIKKGATQKDILSDYEFKQGQAPDGNSSISNNALNFPLLSDACNKDPACRGFTAFGQMRIGETDNLQNIPEWEADKFLGTYLKRKN